MNPDERIRELLRSMGDGVQPPTLRTLQSRQTLRPSRTLGQLRPALVVSGALAILAAVVAFVLLRQGASVEIAATSIAPTGTQPRQLTTVPPSQTSIPTATSIPSVEVFSVGGNLAALTGGSVVAIVSDPEEVHRESDDFAVTRWTRVRVDELLFEDGGVERPTVTLGETVMLLERYYPSFEEGFDYSYPARSPILVSLVYVDFEQVAGEDPLWSLNLAAEIQTDSSLRFLHQRNGDRLDQQMSALIAQLDWGATPAELIAAWTAETTTYAGTGVDGPIELAFAASRQGQTWLARWNATDPRNRALDPEFTPPEILAGLVETPALVQVADDARQLDRYLIIRTGLGVIHAAHLPGGNHPAYFLAPPDSTWEVYISSDAGGTDEILVARILPETWASAVDGSRILIRLDHTVVASPTPAAEGVDPSDLISVLSREQATDLLASWADRVD